jgi:hypothetical protein
MLQAVAENANKNWVRLPFDVKIGKKMVSLGQKKWKRVTSASQMGALL